jgi:hypothetical protein
MFVTSDFLWRDESDPSRWWARLAFESPLLSCLTTHRIERPASKIADTRTPPAYAFDPPTLYQTQSPAGTRNCQSPAQAAASFLQQSARNLLRCIGKIDQSCHLLKHATAQFVLRAPASHNRAMESQWASFHVQICGMYKRPVTITLAKLLPPPRMKSYAWALRRLPPGAQRTATALHTIVTSLPLSRHNCTVLCSNPSLNCASCRASLHPNPNNTALGAAITGAS